MIRNALCFILIISLSVSLFCAALVSAQVTYPATGTIIKEGHRIGMGELTVINDNPRADAVAVLMDLDDKSLTAFYIRSGESSTLEGIDSGEYDLYFTTGNRWNSSSNRFDIDSEFYRLSEPLSFDIVEVDGGLQYSTWTIALQEAVPDANQAAQKNMAPERNFPNLR